MNKTILILFFLCSTFFMIAQTTGPTQPEAAGFAPIGADDMVNLYTGDFNYNIPLMVIPGPDGGYPINMFYNSNVGMDQAASWVGLGWNLNAGAIQRNLRGLPDDFNGDEIEKEFYTKPSTTVSFDYRSPVFKRVFKKEIAGADLEKGFENTASLIINGKFSMYYNNYGGLGINTSINTTLNQIDDSNRVDGFSAGLGLSFGSQEGFSLSPNLSYDTYNKSTNDEYTEGKTRTLAIGATINSKQGFSDLNTSFSSSKKREGFLFIQNPVNESNSWSSGISFASSAPIASIKNGRTSITGNFSFTLDPKYSLLMDNEKSEVSGTFSRSWISEKEKSVISYGAMYMANRTDKNAIVDFYRENEGAITKDNVLTPIPIITYDIFSIQGHGVGGSFRAYQNSIGKLSDAYSKSSSTSVGIGTEIGTGAGLFKAGFDVSASIAGSNSGSWKRPEYYYNELLDYRFNKKTTSKPLFEPFYFKMIGEASALDTKVWDEFEAENPIAFDINRRWDESILAAKAQAHASYNRSGNVFEGKQNNDRNPRTQHIEYLTKDEINGSYITPHIIDPISQSLSSINYDNGRDHHLNGISVLKSNGVRYNYFLPAYNHTTNKVTFAVPDQGASNPKVLDWDNATIAQYAKANNNTGEDEFYSREIIPAYAHTFFITSILSQDYIDIKNDGPSDDDLGTFVKMNYEKIENYKWRFPFKGAYYSKGYLDNEDDDKASFQSGLKDLFYVKSIETKTHVAVFETTNSQLLDVSKTINQKELVSISLFSKADPKWVKEFYLNTSRSNWPTPIQTIQLNQDYTLKKGIPNNDISGMAPALRELYFTYQNSTKGENAKYKFDYGYNPDYKDHQQDRWGAYQKDTLNVKIHENPYTYQNKNFKYRDKEAAAWLLDEVTLPSKGKIDVVYEKDDYAYVQDKKATSFIEFIGTGKDSTDTPRVQMKKEDTFLFFKSPTTLYNDADAQEMVEGMKHIRFRVFMQLRYADKWNKMAYDYVEGYAEVERAGMKNATTGYVQIKPIKPKAGSSWMNPIRLAAFQYIRKSRPDLGPDFGDASNIRPKAFRTRNLLAMINEASVLIAGYYRTALIKGWAPAMSTEKPSYIRLINTKQKYGGGARVKSVTLKSDETDARTFGQNYSYNLPDGKSSGVAEWEPILGIEENPFTQPIWYNANNNGHKIIFSNEQSFSEEPLGAGLYPSASIGYSRVTVTNLEEELGRVKFAQSGINVSEFYTAKDFPTKANRSGALFAPYWAPVPIPFIGEQNTRYNGYSMGYSFTLNNAIYGRAKSVATYPYNQGKPAGEPIQKSVYKYKTLANDNKSLDNKVTTLLKEGKAKKVYMGKEIDFYIDEIEANTFSVGLGSQINLSVQVAAVPLVLPSWFPRITTGRKGTRYLTTNKIIYNTPILDSIIQYKDGAKVSTKNLVFDHETGEPIITSVSNEWRQSIFNYNFPAHWTYENMKGAYKNYRSTIKLKKTSPSSYGLVNSLNVPLTINVAEIFINGDIINTDNNGEFYVTIKQNTNEIELRNRDNSLALFNLDSATIIKSGYKNLQSTKKGKIVSLKDYTNTATNPISGNSANGLIRSFNNN